MAPKQNQKYREVHDTLKQEYKSAILVLTLLVASQVMFSRFVVDAGELTERELFDCTNEIRSEYGQPPLVINDQLKMASLAKMKDMEEYDYWAHQNPVTGKYPWEFVEESGYYYQTSGENLAFGFVDSGKVCEAWKNSKTHLDNIINPDYVEIGFAVEKTGIQSKGKGMLVVQMFGSRKDFSAAGQDLNKVAEIPANEDGTTQSFRESGTSDAFTNDVLSSSTTRKNINVISKYIFLIVLVFAYLCSRLFTAKIVGSNKKNTALVLPVTNIIVTAVFMFITLLIILI